MGQTPLTFTFNQFGAKKLWARSSQACIGKLQSSFQHTMFGGDLLSFSEVKIYDSAKKRGWLE